MFLKVNRYNGYDDWYYKLSKNKKTWEEVLGYIEQVLDGKFIDNNDELVGIKMSIEIVKDVPEDCEMH